MLMRCQSEDNKPCVVSTQGVSMRARLISVRIAIERTSVKCMLKTAHGAKFVPS